MATPAGSPLSSISFNCTNEIFISLDKLTSGSPLPSNVIEYVNPYGYDPQNLPEAVWFLISSKEVIDTEHGEWKTKEEAREVFSNSDIIGWRKTLEFYEGQVPHQHKTDYIMEVFNITLKRLDDENEKKETSSLCRIYIVPTHEIVDNGTRNHLTSPTDLDANSSSSRIGSPRTPEVNKHDDIEALGVAERFRYPEHQGEDLFKRELLSRDSIDFFAGGDFLELKDLDNPAASPSSSSDNSSAMSISSDECFDTLALLQELDDPILEQSNSGNKLDVFAANKPDEFVVVPAALGCLVSVEGRDSSSDESLKSTAGTAHVSASGSRDLSIKVEKRANVDHRRDQGQSPSRKPSESRTVVEGGRKGASSGGMKNFRKKYLCFIPF